MSTILRARDYVDPAGVIVSSGEKIAKVVVAELALNKAVAISLAGMPSISSSYFNVIFRIASENLGVESLDRIDLDSESDLMRKVFERSREACKVSQG